MPTFASLSSFTIDQLESAKLALNVLFIAGTIGVWLGVYLEKETFSKVTQARGWRLLVFSLGAETLFTIAILQIDSVISFRLKESLVGAETVANEARERAAKAELELKKMKVWRHLTPEQQDRIIAKIKSFGPKKFDVGVLPDPEALNLVDAMEGLLKSAGWEQISWRDVTPMAYRRRDPTKPTIGQVSGVGVAVAMHDDHRPEFWDVAFALAAALNEEGIRAVPIPDDMTNINPDAIHIAIGKKPQ